MDKAMLKYEMEKKGLSIGELCKAIGMSKSAFYRKTNGLSEFTHGEIVKICEVLELDSPIGIFFTSKVS